VLTALSLLLVLFIVGIGEFVTRERDDHPRRLPYLSVWAR